MENKDQSAFGYGFCTADGQSHSEEKGLTKREYFAAMAMQGLLANQEVFSRDIEVERAAVLYADALLQELSKPPTHEQ